MESTADRFDAAGTVHVIVDRAPSLVLPLPVPVVQLPTGLTDRESCIPKKETRAIFAEGLQKDFTKLPIDTKCRTCKLAANSVTHFGRITQSDSIRPGALGNLGAT